MPEPLRFVVIRALGRDTREINESAVEKPAEAFPRRMRGPGSSSSVATALVDLEVTEEEVSVDRVGELLGDGSVVGVAPTMPVCLIEPLASDTDVAVLSAKPSWGIEAVAALDASADAGSRATVAILDTGIKADHPAFNGIRLELGDNVCNFTSEANDDLNGHGTFCAATIFGRDVDGTRIGIARGVRNVLIGKVLGKGGGSTESIFQGVTWAISKGAHVISMSLGLDFIAYQETLEAAGYHRRQAASLALAGYRANVRLFDTLSRLLDPSDSVIGGTIVVAAAGNDSSRPDYAITVSPPATGERFLSVGSLGRTSVDQTFSIAAYSNDEVKCAAPGENILSASIDGGLTVCSGTSMAAPHVAGVAALWVDEELRSGRKFIAQAVIEKMRSNVDPLQHLARRDVGWGLPIAPKPQGRRLRTL